MAGALDGVRVIDMATVLAGPGAARHLADFGADVIKVEAPGGDSVRRLGWRPRPDDDAYFWKITARNKRCIVLDLKTEADLATMLRLVDSADVLVENLRPGALERLGLGPDVLHARNPALVLLRVSGFGQDGPYATRPGFASIAEAMSGFASINGEPDGAPLLPPIALTDEVTALAGAFATMVALRHAERTGEGQVIDVNLLESMLQLMGPLPAMAVHHGYQQPRLGAGLPYSVPRGTYRCADGEWIAISTSADSVAQRVLALLGLDGDPRFATFAARMEHRDALEQHMREWVAARSCREVIEAFDAAQAAITRVFTVPDLVQDPHVLERRVLQEIDGVAMQGPVARLSRTPGALRHAGRALDADGEQIRAEADQL